MQDISKQIERAKELLRTVRHAAMATVNEDGSPHNTPFLFLHDNDLTHLYWGSHPDSQHSQNILRTGQLFVVLYDAVERGGLYIRANQGHPLAGDELKQALRIHNQFRANYNKPPLTLAYYSQPNDPRMWSAQTTDFWINDAERNPEGLITKDVRLQISRQDLLGE